MPMAQSSCVDQVEYHRQREIAERKLAEGAIDPAARRAHIELADRHGDLSRGAAPLTLAMIRDDDADDSVRTTRSLSR